MLNMEVLTGPIWDKQIYYQTGPLNTPELLFEKIEDSTISQVQKLLDTKKANRRSQLQGQPHSC